MAPTRPAAGGPIVASRLDSGQQSAFSASLFLSLFAFLSEGDEGRFRWKDPATWTHPNRSARTHASSSA